MTFTSEDIRDYKKPYYRRKMNKEVDRAVIAFSLFVGSLIGYGIYDNLSTLYGTDAWRIKEEPRQEIKNLEKKLLSDEFR